MSLYFDCHRQNNGILLLQLEYMLFNDTQTNRQIKGQRNISHPEYFQFILNHLYVMFYMELLWSISEVQLEYAFSSPACN